MKKKKHYRKRMALGSLVAVLAMAGFANYNQGTPAQEIGLDSVSPLQKEMDRFVQNAVKYNRDGDLYEWQASGYTPEKIIDYIQGTTLQAEGWAALCNSLTRLEDEDLPLFQDQIEDAQIAKNMECAPKLKGRIKRYWASSRSALNAHAAQFLKDDEAQFDMNVYRVLHNEEREIDAHTGPVLPTDQPLKDHEVAITFDDGPHPVHTKKILEILDRENIRVNFFQVGDRAMKDETHRNLTKLAVKNGHIVGSHSRSHINLGKKDIQHAEQEIIEGRDMVARAGDYEGVEEKNRVPFFRFPFGARNHQIQDFVSQYSGFLGSTPNREFKDPGKKDGMATFFWDIDTLDWKIRNPVELFERIRTEIETKKRGIILMHDVHEQTVIVFPKLLALLKVQGYTTVVYVPRK